VNPLFKINNRDHISPAQIEAFRESVSRHYPGAQVVVGGDELEVISTPYKLDDWNHLIPVTESLGDYSYTLWVHMRLSQGEWVQVVQVFHDERAIIDKIGQSWHDREPLL
jgi:hypothetical protein